MAVGMQGYMAIGVESNAGTASSSVATTEFIPFTSENLTIQREDLESQGLANQYDSTKYFNGLQRIQGTVAMECHAINLGYFLRMLCDQTTAFPGGQTSAYAFVNSDAGVRIHRFRLGQTQFQCGSGSDLPTSTIEIFRGPCIDTGSAFCYYNVTANRGEITCEGGQLTRASFDLLGRDYSRKARQTPTYQPFGAIFQWNQVSVSLAGTASTLFESLTIVVNNQLEAVALLDGKNRTGLIKRNGFRTLEVNGRATFRNDTDYDAFVGGSERQLLLTFQGPDTISGSSTNGNYNMFRADIPSFRYLTFPVAATGPGRIVVDFTGRGIFNQGSGTAGEFILVNTRISHYNVNSNG